MRKFWLLLIVSAFPASTLAAEYKAGWTAEKFYEEVGTCRTAIVFPAIKGYLDKGAAHKISDDVLRNETISMLPLFEQGATAACFCAVNEVAKSRDFLSYFGSGDFSAHMAALYEHINGQLCGEKLRSATEALQSKEKRDALQLK